MAPASQATTFVQTLEVLEGGNSYNINVFRVSLEGHPRYRESGPTKSSLGAARTTYAPPGYRCRRSYWTPSWRLNEGNKS